MAVKSFLGADNIDEWRPTNTVLRWGDSGDSGTNTGDSGGGYNASDFGGDFGGSLSDAYSSNYDAGNAYNDASSAFNDAYNNGGFTNYGDNTGGFQGDTFSGSTFSGDQGYSGFDYGSPGVSYTDGSQAFGNNYGGGDFTGGWADAISADPNAGPGIMGYMSEALNAAPGWAPGDYSAWGGMGAGSYAPGPFNDTAPAVAPTMESNQPGAHGQYGTYLEGPLSHDYNQGPQNLGPPVLQGEHWGDLNPLGGILGQLQAAQEYAGSRGHFADTFGPYNGYNVTADPNNAVFAPGNPMDQAGAYGRGGLGLDPNNAVDAITGHFGPAGVQLDAPSGLNNYTVEGKDQSRLGEDTFASRYDALPGLINPAWTPDSPGNLAPGKGGIFEAPDPALLGDIRAAVDFPAVAFPNSGALNNQGINGPMGPMQGGGYIGGGPFGPAGAFQGQSQAIAAQELGEQGRAGRNNYDPGLDFSRPSSVLANQDLLDPETVSRVADDFNSRFGEWGNLNPNTVTFVDPATTTSRGPDARDSFNSRFGEWNNLNNPTQWTSDMYLSDKADNARDSFNSRFGEWQALQESNQNMGRPNSYPTLAEFLGPGRGQSQNIPFARDTSPLQVTVSRAPSEARSNAPFAQSRGQSFNSGRGYMDSLLAQSRNPNISPQARMAALDALNGYISATYGRGPTGSVGRGPYGGDPDPNIAAMLRMGR